MSRPLNLSIPNPCSVNWDQMNPKEKGRYCNQCAQSVYEIEELEESEVVDLLQQQVCMRIKSNSEGKIKVRTGFSSILLLGGLLACGEKIEEPILEVEDEISVEVLQVTAGEPVQVDLQEDNDEELPQPVMGKIAAPVRSQAGSIKMSEVETVDKEQGIPVHTSEKKPTEASKDDCQTDQ